MLRSAVDEWVIEGFPSEQLLETAQDRLVEIEDAYTKTHDECITASKEGDIPRLEKALLAWDAADYAKDETYSDLREEATVKRAKWDALLQKLESLISPVNLIELE